MSYLLFSLVVLRSESLVAISSSESTSGLGVFNGLFEVIEADAPDTELGELVQRSLSASRTHAGFTPPELGRSGDHLGPVYQHFGVRNEKQFTAGTSAASIEADADGIYVQPMLEDGRRGGGFVAYTGTEVELPRDACAADLGAAVRAALDARDLPDFRSGPSHT